MKIGAERQGARIRAIREALNVSRESFGSIFRSGRGKNKGGQVSGQHVYRWEKGSLEITQSQLQELRDTLKAPRAWVQGLGVDPGQVVPLLRIWVDPRDKDYGIENLIEAIKSPMGDGEWLTWLERCHPLDK